MHQPPHYVYRMRLKWYWFECIHVQRVAWSITMKGDLSRYRTIEAQGQDAESSHAFADCQTDCLIVSHKLKLHDISFIWMDEKVSRPLPHDLMRCLLIVSRPDGEHRGGDCRSSLQQHYFAGSAGRGMVFGIGGHRSAFVPQ